MPRYFDIPPCPRCHSPKTGYYIECATIPPNRLLASFLKKGEIVRPMIDKRLSSYTLCFCSECNARWEAIIKSKYITSEELEKQKEKRGISEKSISTVIKSGKRFSFNRLKKRFFKEKKIQER